MQILAPQAARNDPVHKLSFTIVVECLLMSKGIVFIYKKVPEQHHPCGQNLGYPKILNMITPNIKPHTNESQIKKQHQAIYTQTNSGNSQKLNKLAPYIWVLAAKSPQPIERIIK